MKPDEELRALWYWLEPMCTEVPPPRCYLCQGETELVGPEYLWYACRSCFPATHEWGYLNATKEG